MPVSLTRKHSRSFNCERTRSAIVNANDAGRRQAAASREVNQALRTLRGQRLEDLRLTAGPAKHTLVVETDRVRLTLELDTAGARVASLETG